MQAFELLREGLQLPGDAKLLATGMPHDRVVEAVLSGRADAGFVRSGMLEGLAREGRLDLARIRILNARKEAGFPVLLSTRLYPEWPFIALPHVNEGLARRVASALFVMEDNTAETRAMGIHGFGIPADYGAVEEVLRELRLPPFQGAPRFTLEDVWARFRWQLVGVMAAIGLILSLGFRLHLANRRLDAEKRALHASQDMFSKAFAISPDAINITRLADGVYIAVNDGFTKLTGYTPADVLGNSSVSTRCPLWVDARDRDRLVAGLRATGEVVGLEAQFRRKNGTVLTGLMSARVLEINGERNLISITRDITELKLAEEEKARLQSQLQQAQKMESLGNLAGGVAHDMNNVLGAILGLASAHLESEPEGSRVRGAFATIVKAAERGGRMVKSLLSFARQSPAAQHELDLNAILLEELRLLEHTILAKIRLELDLAPNLAPMLGDASALTNVLMNLCINAVDAMPESGTLTLRTRNLDRDWIEVQVADTGIGMPKADQERALEPFFTTKAQGKGTGLGLSMVYSTIKAHHGQLELQSEPGQGTRVRMRFPVCAAPLAAGPAAAERQARGLGPLQVLLVDDDELIQASMEAILEQLGHVTTGASSGEEALAKLSAGLRPDVVILDMNMPGLGGSGTLPRLRALYPALPILLATGRADQAALDLVEAHSKVVLLAKPFSMADLDQNLAILGRV
jgi:PAS domain S-box-containing protein